MVNYEYRATSEAAPHNSRLSCTLLLPPCSLPTAMAVYSKEQTLDAGNNESDDYDRSSRTLLASSPADAGNSAR